MSVDIDILSKISERYSSLRDAEKKVANYIADDLSSAANASITEMAQQANVSEATITRFAKAVECRNVRDLKIKLAQSLAVGQRFIDEPIDQTGMQGVYESIKHTMDMNRKVINEEDIRQCAEWIHGARQTLAIGMGAVLLWSHKSSNIGCFAWDIL